jgi:DNA repair protein SbcC/Rad50
MRPLSLTMTAFGPFPGRETIDFTQLGENPLFLINGPTGSGKTTILDAICFALYGKTTGDEREGAQMRSDLAASDTLTEVSFAFELAGRRFAIRRSPEQQRPKARGEGFTTQGPEAEIKELLAGGAEKLIVASKVSEATREIEELTGLSVDQFRQVMVLPQGQFRQLLMADSGEREKIFGQLFQTRIYRRLEESLKAKAAEIRRERERQLQLQQGMLEGANLASVEALEGELAELEPAEKSARDAMARKEEIFVAADKTYEKAKALQEEFARLETTAAKLKSHEQEKERIGSARERLQRAERAGRLQPLLNERARCRAELTETRKILAQATARQQAAGRMLAAAIEKQVESEKLQQVRDQARQQAAQLEGYRIRADTLAATRQAFQKATREAEQAELLLNFKRLADQYLLLHELEQLVRDRQRQEALVKEKQAQEATLRQSFEKLERQAKALELAWHRGQAAILAAELKAGEPCPVCGSRAHPAPATSGRRLPTQQEVERARQQARDAFTAIEEAQKQTAEELGNLRDLERDLAARRDAVDAATSLPELKMQISALQNRAADLKSALPDRHQVAELDTESLRKQLQSRKDALTETKAQVDAAEQELPANYREPGTLEQAVAQALKQSEQLGRQIEELAAARQRAQNEMTAATTALASAENQQQKTETALKHAGDTWQAALENSPFGDEEDFSTALLHEKQFEALKKQISEYDAAGQRLTGALQQLQGQLREKERPDLQQLAEQRRCAEAEKHQANETWRQFDKRLSLLLATRGKLRKAVAEREGLDRKYAVIGTLSDVANGQTGNKISLQRFVLSVLLDDVLIEASRRLSLMSKGRYQLLRKEDRAKGNKASGLELEVEDAYTGKLRPVATLSGGESFMAALSLALGLSDVVQAYAGGIRLDTLFIDEGFGSLDAESLDLAIRTLIDLQSAGRMVGIISHVAELKEQLARRIDVLAGRAGSSIRVVTP